jgi:Cu/Ag efflux protein CusF
MQLRASSALLAVLTAAIPALAQVPAAAPKYVSVIGTIEKVDAGAKTLAMKTDKGEESSLKFDDRTQFLMLPAGETDSKKATRAKMGDIGAGDRVIARLKQEDQTGPAVFLYFSKQADLAQRAKKTADEWQTQAIDGTVKSIDPATKQIVMAVRAGLGAARDMTLDASGSVEYQRYNPDTAKYDPSNAGFSAIQTGDRVKVLGQRNADQTSIKLEAVASGTFRTVPMQIKTIDVASKTLTGIDLGSKKPITIAVRADTMLRKLDDDTALQMARRLNPTFQQEGGRGARGGRGGGQPAAGDGQAATAGRGGGDAQGGGRGNFAGRGGQGGGFQGVGRGGRNADPSKLLESQPTIELGDLKVGEPVVVTGAAVGDGSKLTAMSLVSGVDPILRAAPQNGPDPLGGSWNFGDGGAPQ